MVAPFGTNMSGSGDSLGILEIKELRGRPQQAEARELLERLRDQVKPICVEHGWRVGVMEEFIPSNGRLLGVNINRGQKIRIRLRTPSDEGSFYPFENVLDTLLHELVHNNIGPHSAKFFKMWDELRVECEKLIREGITGRNMPFAGNGQALGGGRGPSDARAAALKAAEKRHRHQGLMTSGGQRLGGGSGISGGGVLWGASSTGSISAAQRAAAAAEWRYAVSRGCGSHCQDSAATEGQERKKAEWECRICTLLNGLALSRCDVCGTERSAASGTAAAAGSGSGSSSSSRSGGGGGGGGGECASSGGEKRPAPATAATSEASRAGALRKAASSQPMLGIGRSFHGADGSGAGTRRRGGGGGAGLPVSGTWTCRECPFAFPTAAERRTCESCGAAREVAKNLGGSSRSSAGRVAGAGLAAEVTIDRELSSWECGRCTVLNDRLLFTCRTCEAERPLEGVGWTTGGRAGKRARGNGGEGGGGGVDPAISHSLYAGGAMKGGPKICRVCTLRNPSHATDCAACGIPLAESDIAAAAATAATAASACGAAMTTAMGTQTSGGGGRVEVSIIGEGRARDGHGDASRAEVPEEPEFIDLS